jgi:DNA-binding response OmpR family regulator
MSQVPSDQRPILVADDDADIRTLVCIRLEHEGHTTMCAENGDEALSLARERTPKMCVLDIVMGATSGLDVLRELRAVPETSRVPVLLLSASVQEADVQRGLELGADGYLQKPFHHAELIDRVSQLLSGELKEPMRAGDFQ